MTAQHGDSAPYSMTNGAWFVRVNLADGLATVVLAVVVIAQFIVMARLLRIIRDGGIQRSSNS